jgi:nitrogen regulatory protein P-II 1
MAIAREIKAIIRQAKLDDVLGALRRIPGLPGVTVSLVRGFGKPLPPEGMELEHAPMNKLEIVVAAEMAETVIQAIVDGGWTGQVGDGKVFVYDVGEIANIRTKNRGLAAL